MPEKKINVSTLFSLNFMSIKFDEKSKTNNLFKKNNE